MIRTAICDDDVYIIDQIQRWLQEIAEELRIRVDIERFSDGTEIVNAMKENSRFHIIFMDIVMEELDGLSAAVQIRERDWNTIIIYISNHKDYVFQSFEARPFHYLLKPIEREKFYSVFMSAYHEILKYQSDFIFETGRKQIRLPLKDILYFVSNNKKVEAHFTDYIEEFPARLNQVENQLLHSDYPFIRIHKSYLVNYQHIISKTPDIVELSDRTILQISRNMKESASRRYAEMVIRMKGH